MARGMARYLLHNGLEAYRSQVSLPALGVGETPPSSPTHGHQCHNRSGCLNEVMPLPVTCQAAIVRLVLSLISAPMQPTPAMFIAGDPALDFLNSVATPIDSPVDWLDDGDGLLSWLEQAKLVSDAVLTQVRSQSSLPELNKVAKQARNLREWFRGFVQKHRGRPLARDDLKKLERLNRLLERDDSFNQIAPATGKEDDAFELRVMRKWRSAEGLLFPIAEAIARFVCEMDFTDVKACEGATCTLFFADQTRGRARRWCSMAMCGNRAKQTAHRQRVKANR